MRILGLLAVAVSLVSTETQAAEPQATFLGARTYAAAGDCSKLKRVADAGSAAKSLPLLPKTLSAKGFDGPDSTCRFTNIDERYADRLWTITMSCSSGDPSNRDLRSQVWRKQADGAFAISEGRDVATWVACPPDAPAAAAKRR